MQAAALFQIAMAALPLVTMGVNEFIKWIESIKTHLQQTGEWTIEQEAQFVAGVKAKNADPAYQPDPK